jgi:hypothetical protein
LYESPLVYIESVNFTQQEAETCDSILVTYTLVGEEPVTVESTVSYYDENSYPVYIDLGVDLFYNNDLNKWQTNFGDSPYLETNSECPFGTYTIEEGSIFEAFEVSPVMLTVPSWSYEPLNVMNELSRQKTSKRDMLIQEQVTAKRTFDYKSQIL